MAKIEKDFIERENPTKRDFKAEPFIPRKPIPDLGHEKLDGKRFYSREFMQKEWDSVWSAKVEKRLTRYIEPLDFFTNVIQMAHMEKHTLGDI